MNFKTYNRLSFEEILLFFSTLMILIYQIPTISVIKFVGILVYSSWGLLFLICLLKQALNLRKGFYLLLFINIFFIAYSIINQYVFMKEIFFLRELFLTTAMIIIGYLLSNYKTRSIDILLNVYLIGVCVVSFDAYVNYLNGNLLNTSNYLYPFKNSLGIIIVNSILYIIIFKLRENKRKIFYFVLLALLLTLLFGLQNRTGLIALFVSVLFLITNLKISRRIMGSMIAGIILLIALFLLLPSDNTIFKIINRGLMLNVLEDQGLSGWSSSRLDMINFGLGIFKENSFFGSVEALGNNFYIESFYIQYISSYGLVGVLFLVIFFGSIFTLFFKNYRQNKFYKYSMLLILVMITTAFFEQMSPFGPGGVYFISWIMIGYSIGFSQEKGVYE